MFLNRPPSQLLGVLAFCALVALSAAAPTQSDLKTFDAQVEQGTLTLRTDRVIVSLGRSRTTRELSVYAYRGKDWSQRLEAVDSEGRRHRQMLTALRGQGVVADDDTKTIIVSGRTPKVEKSDEFVGFVLGPSLPLGRGLSRLTSLRSKGESLIGTASDTGVLEATFGKMDAPLPKRVRRLLPGGFIVDWNYSGWRPMHGVWMPTLVESAPNKGELQIFAKYAVEAFDPQTPSSLEPLLIRRGFKLIDQRVEPQQAYGESELREIAGAERLTLERLLEVSKNRGAAMNAAFAKGAAGEEEAKKRTRRSTAVIIASVGLGITGLIGLTYARRLFRKG